MNTTTTSELGREARNAGCNYGDVWDACCGPVYLVLNEEGNNPANGKIRHFIGKHWLYVDDTDGYAILAEADADRLILTPEEE